MSILIFLLLLVGLVIVHECGHFFAAKIFGIRVEEFGIGFPPRLLSIRLGETEYSLNGLPFGGFVRIFGERPDEGGGDPRAFGNKSRLVQAAVVVAGVLCNFIFAWFALSAGYMAGLPAVVTGAEGGTVHDVHITVIGVSAGSPAEAAGFLSGDIVKHIQAGSDTLSAEAASADARAFIAAHADEEVTITVLRGSKETMLVATPETGVVDGRKALGIGLEDVGRISYAPLAAMKQGGGLSLIILQNTAHGLWGFGAGLFSGHANFTEVAGPIGIAEIGGSAVREGYAAVILLIAVISINLAIINLLPIPGLDGGRLVFIAIEAIKGSSVSERLTVGLTLVGFALMAVLLLMVTYHDLIRLFD